MNPYTARMDVEILQELASTTQGVFQKRAEVFYHSYFYQCGVCHRYF